jgi:archaellum biogenesis protein FlaJ (TadC family)
MDTNWIIIIIYVYLVDTNDYHFTFISSVIVSHFVDGFIIIIIIVYFPVDPGTTIGYRNVKTNTRQYNMCSWYVIEVLWPPI